MNQRKTVKISKQINSQSDSYELQAHQMKRFGFQINKKRITQGSWCATQNKIYLQFLKENQSDFETQLLRRKSRVFYRISKLLKKRTPDQCRSHHQKLLNKHKGDIKEVIQQLISKTSDEIEDQCLQGKSKTKVKNTSPCTIDFANQSKEKEKSSQICNIQPCEYFKFELREQFLQLNIDLSQIKQW